MMRMQSKSLTQRRFPPPWSVGVSANKWSCRRRGPRPRRVTEERRERLLPALRLDVYPLKMVRLYCWLNYYPLEMLRLNC